MIANLIKLSLARPLFVALAMVLFVGAGIYAFSNLPIEAFPDVTDTQANVIALYPGHAAEEVEQQVTIPLEIALAGMPHAVNMFSHTQQGLAYIVVTFDDGATDYFARQQTLERMTTANLPPNVQPTLAPLTTAIGEVFRYRLKGDGYDSRQLRGIEDWTVEKYLRQVPGVADIVSMGGQVKQYVVTPDLGRLRDTKVSIAQIYAALQRANANSGGGVIQQGAQQFLLRGIGLLQGTADISDTVVAENNGVAIRIRDIATVEIGSAQRQGINGMDNDDDIVVGTVDMRKGENPSTVLAGVKAKIEELNNGILPKGVRIEPYYDRDWLISRTLHTVFHNLVEGALLVSLVLWFFLGNVRAALIVACIIPVALLATFVGLRLLGMPANLLSLGAMDFGILVDGAVIVVENIFRRLSSNPSLLADPRSRREAVFHAAVEVGRPTLFSMIIIIAAHIPIFTLQRQEGRIFSPMAYSVTSALIGSLLMSLTLVPLLSYLLLNKNLPHEETRMVEWLKRHYRSSLAWALQRPKQVITIAVGALIASLAMATQLGSEFLPELNEGSIWMNATLPASISVDEAFKETRRIREALHTVPEVDVVVSKAGRPEDGTDPKVINSLEVAISMKPEDQWRKGIDREQIVDELDAAVRKLPGVRGSFDGPIYDNVLESISQVDGQIVIRVFGEDLQTLNATGHQILDLIRKVPGVVQAEIDREGALPQYMLTVDRPAAARYGLNVADIQDLIETAMGDKPATELYEGEAHYSVVVRLSEQERAIGKLKDTLIATPDGAHIPLSAVVHFSETSGAMDIARQNGGRMLSVGVFIRDRDMGSVVKDMQDVVGKNVQLPEHYRIVWTGEFENQQRAMARLSVVVPISILLIFFLLFNAFNSVKSASLIVANIPFALIGGIFGLAVVGLPLSVSAAIGFIALFGQAVLNGVVMVSHFDQLRDSGMPTFDAVVQGTQDRLRTALMTTLLAMLGLLPMALSHDIGSETQRPLAIVVIGGLISSTLLTLFVLPTLYALANRKAVTASD
ncbi:MAG TPA: CusA/CzcA family heavy metal efflux RND transporter [Candidatus Acidoferrum sp.]|nr:CusA/CzcA family heavy metal efflux RND transporter [Candidatus Acidoferrum sp.]